MESVDVPLVPSPGRSRNRLTVASPARADYNLVRWASGDCKIWVNDGNPPWGDGWIVLVWNIPTYDLAWGVLREEAARGTPAGSNESCGLTAGSWLCHQNQPKNP